MSAEGHRKLTTQINIDGDPLVIDDFADATREGLVPAVVERTDAASIRAEGLSAPFAEIVFDIQAQCTGERRGQPAGGSSTPGGLTLLRR